jgi:1-phosphatidylinositol-3-phosphate 5-kinase
VTLISFCFVGLTLSFSFSFRPTVLCKIVGVYQIGVHNKITGKRSMEQVAVMQNIFYKRRITRIFDLKGSLRGRFAAHKEESSSETPSRSKKRNNANRRSDDRNHNGNVFGGEMHESKTQFDCGAGSATLLDGDFLEFTMGRPMPLTDRAKAVFQMSILNVSLLEYEIHFRQFFCIFSRDFQCRNQDTLFLSIINVLDYSILIGVDEDSMELVVGIIDFMRQYDILKQMERVGKSLPMVVGSEAPTIIQPPLYKARFTNAMERYFMTVPSKWTTI